MGTLKFYGLDSMESRHRGVKGAIDKYVAYRLLENLHVCNAEIAVPSNAAIKFERITLPKQHNSDDCGIFSIKYMQMWDPDVSYDGNMTMPTWTEAWVKKFRIELVCSWVLDDRNEYKEEVLRKEKLSATSAGQVASSTNHSNDKDKGEVEGEVGPSPRGGIDAFLSAIPESSIANRVKGQGRRREKGPQTRTPFPNIRKYARRKKSRKN